MQYILGYMKGLWVITQDNLSLYLPKEERMAGSWNADEIKVLKSFWVIKMYRAGYIQSTGIVIY